MVTQSEGTAFAHKGKDGKGKAAKGGEVDPKSFEYDKDYYKDKECFRCGK